MAEVIMNLGSALAGLGLICFLGSFVWALSKLALERVMPPPPVFTTVALMVASLGTILFAMGVALV